MTKKIGILTLYYKNANYGGLLQAYALQKTIENMGFNAKQISYDLETGYPGFHVKRVERKIKTIIKMCIKHKWYKKNTRYKNKIYEFAPSIPHTKVYTKNRLKDISGLFDFFVVGSDQVWNPVGWQSTFFFDFLPSDKECMSYAASIGRTVLTEDEKVFIKNNLNRIKYISVREHEAQKILSEFTDKEVQLMPDPTILLSADDWDKIASKRIISEPYVFAYCLGNDFNKRNQIIKNAERQGLRTIFIPFMNKDSFTWDLHHENNVIEDVGIPEFLSLIKNAEYVITDSFHGTVFSLIYHKPFYTFSRFKNTDPASMNSRINTLLNSFEMIDKTGDDIPEMLKPTDYNFEKVDTILKDMQKVGKNYLGTCLNN